MAGYYQLIEAYDGHVRFQLRAGNHEVIFVSRVYASKAAAIAAVDWMRGHAADPERYVRASDIAGARYFMIVDALGHEVGRSELYAGRSGVETGIASVRRNCTAGTFKGLIRCASLSA